MKWSLGTPSGSWGNKNQDRLKEKSKKRLWSCLFLEISFNQSRPLASHDPDGIPRLRFVIVNLVAGTYDTSLQEANIKILNVNLTEIFSIYVLRRFCWILRLHFEIWWENLTEVFSLCRRFCWILWLHFVIWRVNSVHYFIGRAGKNYYSIFLSNHKLHF